MLGFSRAHALLLSPWRTPAQWRRERDISIDLDQLAGRTLTSTAAPNRGGANEVTHRTSRCTDDDRARLRESRKRQRGRILPICGLSCALRRETRASSSECVPSRALPHEKRCGLALRPTAASSRSRRQTLTGLRDKTKKNEGRHDCRPPEDVRPWRDQYLATTGLP